MVVQNSDVAGFGCASVITMGTALRVTRIAMAFGVGLVRIAGRGRYSVDRSLKVCNLTTSAADGLALTLHIWSW